MHPKMLIPLTFPLILAACLGGSGSNGGGGVDGSAVSFASMSDIQRRSLVTFMSPDVVDEDEEQVTMSLNYNASVDEIDGVDLEGEMTYGDSELRLRFDKHTEPRRARLTVGFDDATVTAVPAATPTRSDSVTRFMKAPVRMELVEDDDDGPVGNRDDYLMFANMAPGDQVKDMLALYLPDDKHALEYLTFGAWALGMDTAAVDLGAAVWGAATPVAAMVSRVGSASYEGGLLGTLVDEDGDLSFYEARSTIGANFDTNSVSLSSTDTRNLMTGADAADLNLSTVADARIFDNGFSGGTITIASEGPDSVGRFGGSFFGPGAQEVGGVFEAEGDFGRYFGSFGGKEFLH